MLPREKRRGGVFEATVFAIVGIAILDRPRQVAARPQGLERKSDRDRVDAHRARRRRLCRRARTGNVSSRRPANIPASLSRPNSSTAQEAYAYTAGSSLRTDVEGQGFWVFAPARLAGGSIVLINRGFVPTDRKNPATRAEGRPRGSVDIVGYMRWPEARGLFTPSDDAKNNVWYVRDPKAMADAHKWSVAAPFYIDQEAPGAARRLAEAGQDRRENAEQASGICADLVRPGAGARRRLCRLARRPAATAARPALKRNGPDAW